MTKVLLQVEQYRFIERGIIPSNNCPDYRIQKKNEYTKLWHDAYLLDNSIQCSYAMEDLEYAKFLCGDPAYGKKDYDED